MAKVRIHALAKELEVQSKDVIQFLTEKNIEVKSASSSVEEDVAGIVKAHFSAQGKSAEKAETKSAKKSEDKAATKSESKTTSKSESKTATKSEGKMDAGAAVKSEAKTDAEATVKLESKSESKTDAVSSASPEKKPEVKADDRPKKKSSITAVFNPQNSKMGGDRRQRGHRPGSGRPDGARPQGQGQGQRPTQKPQGQSQRMAQQRQQEPQQPQRSASERAEAVKAKFDKILGVDRPTITKQEVPQKPVETPRPEYTGKVLAPEKPIVKKAGEGKPAADKAVSSDRASRSERPERPAGDRPVRPGSTSGQDRRSRAGRVSGQERPERPERSERPYRNGSVSGQDRPSRAGSASGQDRPERPYRNASAAGQDRPERPYRAGSAAGQDRPVRSDRPAGQDRGGQNRFSSDRGSRSEGDRNGSRVFQNNRPGATRVPADKNGQRVGGSRPKEQRNRFEQEINKMNQNAPIVADEPRKESRDSRRGNVNQKQTKDRAKGPKRQERLVNLEKSTGKHKKTQQVPAPVEKKEDEIRTIILPEKLTIKEFADAMKVQASAIVKKLFLQGIMVTVNQEIDYEKAEEIALEFNCICEMEEKVDVIEELLKEDEEDESKMVKRPPVVCVMGHVDHGKTSLLDAIRDTHVIDREAGGITQHIGAYMVTCNGEKITFLDTPGHEAFTAMRMRGANATDIAILVVAADDGVMPQTVEAISHAKAAGVDIIVAINKIDKPSANVERVKQELSEYELIPEDWGGSTIFVPVSAHTHEGIDTLLEMILLTAEIGELKADPRRHARGLVIEAQLDKGRGAVATVLVQKGTLKVGQPIAAGSCYGKVRAMIDDKGRRVKEAGPSTPVEILGLNNVPNAGEVFVSTETEKEAKSFADTFISQGREKLLEDTKAKMSLDDLFTQIQSGNVKELNIIVKADVQGSVEAVKQSLVKLSNEEVVVKVIHAGVGAINESDVSLASASNAIIIGFNVRPDVQAKASAEREGVDMRLYKVIYNAIEDVEAAMKGMLDPVYEEKILGHAEIRQIFKASGIGNIAGSYVLDGVFQRNCKVRISREGEQLFEGGLASLKRFKDDVKEVRAGYECGLVFDGFNDFQELDIVEAYTMVEVSR